MVKYIAIIKIYYLGCKKYTNTKNREVSRTSDGRIIFSASCTAGDSKKNEFV